MPPIRKPETLKHLHGMHDNPSGQRAADTAAPAAAAAPSTKERSQRQPEPPLRPWWPAILRYTVPNDTLLVRQGTCVQARLPLSQQLAATDTLRSRAAPGLSRAARYRPGHGQALASWNIHCPRDAALLREAPARPRRTPLARARRGASRRSAKAWTLVAWHAPVRLRPGHSRAGPFVCASVLL